MSFTSRLVQAVNMKPEEVLEMEMRLRQEGVCVEISSDSERLNSLWRLFVEKENSVRMLTQELEELRARHAAEIDRVQLYIRSIRSLSKTRDSMALDLEQENETIRSNLAEINLQREAQMSEIVEMLVQEGLAEVVSCSLSEQVAYLLADRAALMEKIQTLEDAGSKTLNVTRTQEQRTPDENAEKVASLRGQSPWKRLLGFRKATLAKQDAKQADEDKASEDRERSLLERDLEEASTRLNMAHKEIRRLTAELESAHLTNSTYKSELHGAQVEAEQLRHEVETLKRCDLAEAQASEVMNDVLDAVICHLKDTVDDMGPQLLLDRNFEDEDIIHALTLKLTAETVPRMKVEEERDDKRRRTKAEQLQNKDDDDGRVRHLQLKLLALGAELEKVKALLAEEEEQDQDLAEKVPDNSRSTQDVLRCMLLEQENLKLKQEIEELEEFCEKLQIEVQQVHCTLHGHVRKYDETKRRYRERLAQAKEVYLRETRWRDQKNKEQEGELDILMKRLKKESDMVKMVTAENEALLRTKKTLLSQLNEAEEDGKNAAAKLSSLQLRVYFLEKDSMHQWEMNMKKSTQIAKLERRLWDMQALKSTRYLRKHHRNHAKDTKEGSGSETSTAQKTKDEPAENLRISAAPSPSSGTETGYMNIFTHNLG